MRVDSNLSRLLASFHASCLNDPRRVARSESQVNRILPEFHGLFGKKPTPFSLTPFLFSKRFYRSMEALCSNMADVLEEAGEAALIDEELLAAYQFPDHFKNILRVSPGYRRLAPILRLDGHFVNGIFRLVETNADGSAGMNDSNAIERAVLMTECYRHFESRAHIRSCEMVQPLARMLLKYLCNPAGAVGILDMPGVSTAAEFVAVKERIENLGGAAGIVTPKELGRHRGLYARGHRIDLIYRRLVTADALKIWNELAPLIEAYRKHEIVMVGSFRSELLHNKAILAILHDKKIHDALDRPSRNLIARHVPESRLLTPESAERATASKNKWVIKPLDAYGSRGVAVGRTLSARAWKDELKLALRAGRYLLQEYTEAPRSGILRLVNGRPKLSPEMTSVGFFLYDGKMAGPYVRSGPRHPLSISCGAVTRPGFVCE